MAIHDSHLLSLTDASTLGSTRLGAESSPVQIRRPDHPEARFRSGLSASRARWSLAYRELVVPALVPNGGALICDIYHAVARRTQTSRRGRQSKDAKVELLRNVSIFSACSKRDLRRIAALVDEIEVPDRGVLMRQGDPGKECFVIVKGQAKATVRGSGSASLGPGDVVGEMSLLDHGPRSATVTARTDMHLLVLSSREFSALIDQVPLVARRIMAALAGRVREVESREPLAPHLRAST